MLFSYEFLVGRCLEGVLMGHSTSLILHHFVAFANTALISDY